MRKNKNDYKGIYSDMVEILGEEIVMKLHEHYRGQQITFPMKLYSNEYIEKYIVNNCRNKTLKDETKEEVYTDVVAPIITRAEWEEIQIQKEKSRSPFL